MCECMRAPSCSYVRIYTHTHMNPSLVIEAPVFLHLRRAPCPALAIFLAWARRQLQGNSYVRITPFRVLRFRVLGFRLWFVLGFRALKFGALGFKALAEVPSWDSTRKAQASTAV